MRKYLVNAISLNMFDIGQGKVIKMYVKPLTVDRFCHEVRSSINAVGHQSTADLINALCGVYILPNRVEVKLGDGDELVVIQVHGRLPEGKVLSYDEVVKMYEEGKIKLYHITCSLAEVLVIKV